MSARAKPPEQLLLPGFEDSPWQLLDRPPALAHGAGGPDRLLRALIRRGLDDDAWPIAAALVVELDVEAGERR
jgi:hypothetical protein